MTIQSRVKVAQFHHFFVSGLQERGLIFPTEDEVVRKMRVHKCNPKENIAKAEVITSQIFSLPAHPGDK